MTHAAHLSSKNVWPISIHVTGRFKLPCSLSPRPETSPSMDGSVFMYYTGSNIPVHVRWGLKLAQISLFVFFTNARKRLPKMHEDLNGHKSIGHKYSGAVCDLWMSRMASYASLWLALGSNCDLCIFDYGQRFHSQQFMNSGILHIFILTYVHACVSQYQGHQPGSRVSMGENCS